MLVEDWRPNPGKQHRFISCPEREILYGGAKGGGKTDGLLMAAVQDYRSQYMRAIIFRRTYRELTDLIKRSKEFYPLFGGTYFRGTKEWRFPAGGTLEFSYLKREADIELYQGRAFTFIGVDEIAQLSEEKIWVTMLSCLRAPKYATGVTLRAAATCNPVGAGRGWVKNRWGIPNEGTATQLYDHEAKCWRVFIPARISDNPHLADTDYMTSLNALPERLRLALRDGRWDAVEGAMFADFDPAIHICEPFPIPSTARIWRGADDGYNAPAAVLWFAEIDQRTYVIGELYAKGMTSEVMAEKVLNRDRRIPILGASGIEYNDVTLQGTIDSSAFNEVDGPTKTGRGQRMNALGCKWQPVQKGRNSRQAGWSLINSKLTNKLADGKPELIIFNSCRTLIDALPLVTIDENDPEDIDPDFKDDHILDALSYGLRHRRNTAGTIKVTGM